MNCDQFHSWLENRDFSDQSESDQAMKHKNNCQRCQQFYIKDNMLDQAIRDNMGKEPLPENLEKIVSLNLGSGKTPERRIRSIFIRLLSTAAGVSALVLLYLFVPTDFSARNDFGNALVRDHVHHNYDQDLETIDNLDNWLSLRTSFGAAVPARFDWQKGYRLFGGTICVIKTCRTVHLVYREGDGLISLYIIDAAQVPADLDESRIYSLTSNGYTIEMWKEQQQVFAVII